MNMQYFLFSAQLASDIHRCPFNISNWWILVFTVSFGQTME